MSVRPLLMKVFLALTTVLAAAFMASGHAEIAPPWIDLRAGDCAAPEKAPEPVQVGVTMIPRVDVVLSMIDIQIMTRAADLMHANLLEIVSRVRAELPGYEVRFGVVSHEDYPIVIESCGYVGSAYGIGGAIPFRVDAPLGASDDELRAALRQWRGEANSNDFPENFGRVLWEVCQPDSGVGLDVEAARRVLFMFCKNLPHDCDPSGDLPPESSLFKQASTGVDPGRDMIPGNEDDIDWQDDALRSAQKADLKLYPIFVGEWIHSCMWKAWAASTGGEAVKVGESGKWFGEGTISDWMVNAIKGSLPELKELSARISTSSESEEPCSVTMKVKEVSPGESGLAFTLQLTMPEVLPAAGTLEHCEVEYLAGDQVIARQPLSFGVGDVDGPEIEASWETVEGGKWKLLFSATDLCGGEVKLRAVKSGTDEVVESGTIVEGTEGPAVDITATDERGNSSLFPLPWLPGMVRGELEEISETPTTLPAATTTTKPSDSPRTKPAKAPPTTAPTTRSSGN